MSDTKHSIFTSKGEKSLVKKLTVERIMSKEQLKPMAKEAGKRWLCEVVCFVTGSKEESSTFGPYYRWLGQFQSCNLETGELLTSANAIFPGIAADVIEAAYVGGNKIGGESGNIMVAFRIGIEHDMNKAGYKYCLSLIQHPSYRSPLDMFITEVGGALAIAAEDKLAIEAKPEVSEPDTAAGDAAAAEDKATVKAGKKAA